MEYKIIYRIGGDIPINPSWIGDQLQDAVDALQEKINEKNLHGTHTLELCFPDGWKPQAPSNKRQATSNKLQKLDPTIDWNKFLKELTK